MSSSPRVLTTCRDPVRSETRQFSRRSRSPDWKGRIAENSVPSPGRRERWAPTRPSGCGASARESNGARTGSTSSRLPATVTGPQR